MAAPRAVSARAAGQGGFTLVEVLVAATILFFVIAAAADAYRTALASSARAEATVRMLVPLPLITASVREAIREKAGQAVQGRASLLGVDYEFEAASIRTGSPPTRFDPDTAQFRDYPPRFHLYRVQLTLRSAGVARSFTYREVAWQPAALD
jgi:prepilin-type N-terminal cleavage/methylation domain-containing protein